MRNQPVFLKKSCSFSNYLKYSWSNFREGIRIIKRINSIRKRIEKFDFDSYPASMSELFVNFIDSVEIDFNYRKMRTDIFLNVRIPKEFKFRKNERDFCGLEVYIESLIRTYFKGEFECSCVYLTSDGKIHRNIDEIDCNLREIDDDKDIEYCIKEYLDSI